MKTKHLLTALALPAVFAACTADDIVTEGVNNQTQRVALSENFKMNFGGVESRLSAGKPGEAFEFSFENGDKVGGAIIDQYTPASTTPTTQEAYEAQYGVVDFVSANQPFTFDGSEWTLEHTMVEGKYLFYYPYNEANNSRGAAQFSIPVMQDLSDKETGKFNPKAAIERYGMAVGYQFLSKEDLSASVELVPIFSYARIVLTLDNAFAGGEVDKIVLQAGTKKVGDETVQEYFNLAGQLGNKKIADIFNQSKTNKEFKWSSIDETADFALDAKYTVKENGADVEKDNAYYNNKLQNQSILMVGKVPAGTKMSVDAQNNKTFETYMVMPAQDMENPITVYLYTTDGNIYSGETGTTFNGDFNRNTPKKVQVTLGRAEKVPFVIASQEDWNASVAQLSKNDEAEFLIADPNFVITNDLKYPENATIELKGDVVVKGDNVTMKNIIAETIKVAEGAKLTADYTVDVTSIENKGEVVIPANPEVKESRAAALEQYQIDAIVNYATLTVNKGAVITTALTNKKDAEVKNAGELTLSGTNEGTIANAGTIYVEASKTFVNNAREWDLTGEEPVLLNEPTISIAVAGKLRADGKLTNNSLIVNEGIFSCKNNAGAITNAADGVIDAKTGCTTFVSANSGKVIVYAMDQANVTTTGNVEYTATKASEDTKSSIVTHIVATKDLEIKLTDKNKAGNFANLTVKGNANIKMTWPTGETLPTLTSLTIESGNATIGSDFTVNKLVVKEGASINVPADYTLKINQVTAGTTANTLLNEGTISVIGQFIAKDYAGNEDAVGDVEDNGKGTITWKDSPETVAKATYIEKLSALVKFWAEHPTGLNDVNGSVAKVGYDLYAGTNCATAKATLEIFIDKDLLDSHALVADVIEALAAYNEIAKANYEAKNDGTYTPVAFMGEYKAAAKKYIDAVKATTAYTTAVTNLAKNKVVMPQNDNATNRFYVATGSGDTAKSAETYALEAAKVLIARQSLTDATKAVLCSETAWSTLKAYIPAYTFAFESDNVYKYYKDYVAKYDLSAYNEVELTGLVNDVKTLGNKTEAEVKALTSVGEKKLHAFIVANDYEVYDEAMEWNYTDATIAAIARAAAGN